MSKTKRGVCANCHKVFELSRKQAERIKQGKSVYCCMECGFEKNGKSRIVIHDIPCCKCGTLFTPTRQQYKSYKYNNNVSISYCSDECRYKRDYPFTPNEDYVIVYVGNDEVLLDWDIFEDYGRTIYIAYDKRNGYKTVSVFHNGCKKRLARYILDVTGSNIEIDHINGNTLDNRRSNLRIVTHTENMWNKDNYKNNTSDIKGVHLNKKGLWVARIQVGKDRLFLGSSKDKSVAEKLRLDAEKKYFGKYDRKFLK